MKKNCASSWLFTMTVRGYLRKCCWGSEWTCESNS